MVILPPFLNITHISVIGLYYTIIHGFKKCQGERSPLPLSLTHF